MFLLIKHQNGLAFSGKKSIIELQIRPGGDSNDQLIGKIYNKLSKADIAGTQGKVAVQFNLTGKVTGVFYIEILNGVLSVMPYEYIDRDACVSGTLTNLEKILSGKMVPQVALAEGKIKVEGNVDKVMVLAELLKQA